MAERRWNPPSWNYCAVCRPASGRDPVNASATGAKHGKAPSSHTGAYNQARQALPLSMVEKSCDHIFEQLVAQMDQDRHRTRRTCLHFGWLDHACGTHSGVVCMLILRDRTNMGRRTGPLMRVLVAHDVHTGLAHATGMGSDEWRRRQ